MSLQLLILRSSVLIAAMLVFDLPIATAYDPDKPVKQTKIEAPHGMTITVRMQGPYDIKIPLQTVCYFRHKDAGDRTLGAAVELDNRLGGVIASLRNRGEFAGESLETLLISPKRGSITPDRLLLIGVGDEDSFSLDLMEKVGRIALRETVRLNAKNAAFAPIIRDQGNSKFATGDVAQRVLKGMLLAYDTEKRMQAQGIAPAYDLEDWIQEAGPNYFDETVIAAKNAIAEAKTEIAKRSNAPYATAK